LSSPVQGEEVINPLLLGEGKGEVEVMKAIKNITRALRKNQTPWESRLWRVLRNRQVNNLKFRRQCNIGPYIVDFCCYEKKLIVELDGSQHLGSENRGRDQERDSFLRDKGFQVIRFHNNEINENLEGVVETIINF